MRTVKFISGSFLITSMFSLTLSGQAEHHLVFTINAGEAPVYDESRLFLENSENISMVTMNDEGKYFLYENGERKGPFDDAASTGFHESEDQQEMYSSIYNYESQEGEENLISYDSNGKLIIHAGDRDLGPFEVVLNIFTDNSGKFLSAIVSENMKYSMITTSGSPVPLVGAPYFTAESPDGSKVMIVTVNETDPALDYMDRDLSNMSQDELLKITAEIEAKQKNAPPPETFIYFSDGKKYGPYPKDPVYDGNPGFCKTGGNNWMLIIDKDLYVNGSVVAHLSEDYVSTGDIWLSQDGKRFAILSYDNIQFSDGESFSYPLKIQTREKDGKTWLYWLSLDNGTDVVLYSKAL
jgi:hypothetical protein